MQRGSAKKGISPTFAEIFLILIAAIAAIVVYSFAMGFVGTSSTATLEAQAMIVVDEAKFNKTGYSPDSYNITVWVRNVGEIPVTVLFLYLEDINGTFITAGPPVNLTVNYVYPVTIPPGQVYAVTLNISNAWWMIGNSRAYKVLIVTKEGAVAPSPLVYPP